MHKVVIYDMSQCVYFFFFIEPKCYLLKLKTIWPYQKYSTNYFKRGGCQKFEL